jgi:tRNA (mo5U34)-methyltransferase
MEPTHHEDEDEVRRAIERLGPWFHNFHLPDGVETCPDHFLGDFPSFKWRSLARALPQDLRGWTALDIGCNAGFYSFELARRGAAVTAIDSSPLYLAQARWVADRIGMTGRVRFERRSAYDLVRSTERYDLVLFMGVFYHLRYPLLALDTVSRLVSRLFVFQTLMTPEDEVTYDVRDLGIEERERLLEPGWPKMSFIEHKLERDPTNWWATTNACAEALLRSTGMQVVARPLEETFVCVPDRGNESSFWTWDSAEYLDATGQSARLRHPGEDDE